MVKSVWCGVREYGVKGKGDRDGVSYEDRNRKRVKVGEGR